MQKRCGKCKETKPLDSFYNLKTSSDGKGYRCKPCDKEAKRKWLKDKPEHYRNYQRRNNLKTKYGITMEDYYDILEKQGGVCGICGAESNCYDTTHHIVDNFAVDHCHTTGKVRGLLCNQCNRGLGMLGDTSEALEKAYKYLKNVIDR